MLYFSKLKIISVLIFTLVVSFFTLTNFIKIDNNIFNRNINLGLDLQGGSYLLLEIDNTPVIIQKLQSKLTSIKGFLKDNDVKSTNFKILDKNKISFVVDEDSLDKVISLLNDKESEINPYFQRFKTHEFIVSEKKVLSSNHITLQHSDYGLVLLKSSSQDQAIEIVRRRVDEIGTNEPNILKRGNDRILVELPGLDNPDRIKNLLGKTANLTFRFVVLGDEESFGTEKLLFDDGSEAIVSKRIIMSGDNLVDAQPRMDNQTNQTVVTFNLDRVGAKKFAKATSSGVGKKLAIILDGRIISAPNIVEPIIGGAGRITGDFTFQTATDLALLLRSGALPAPMKIIEEIGDSENMKLGQIVSTRQLRDENSLLKRENKNLVLAREVQPATAKPELQGITRASLQTKSFIARQTSFGLWPSGWRNS